MSSGSDSHCSSNDKLLEGVEVHDGRFEKSGCATRGEEGADEGREDEVLVS